MAGSMKDIKLRIKSVESTMQITKAMELVASSKMRRAKERVEHSRPYFETLHNTLTGIAAADPRARSPYLRRAEIKRTLLVVIAGDRGLAGGYNSNLIKLVTGSDFSKDDVEIYAIGGKGREVLERRGYHIKEDDSYIIESPSYDDAAELCKKVLADYTNGTIGEIYLVYTHFKNTVVHEPKLMKLLPIEFDEEELGAAAEANVLMNYEPNETEALDMIIPKYVTSLFYGALVEAVASENGARMQAMDSATSNAEDMISDLTLKYNRARQGSITQELTEIIAGASAISG